MAKTFASVCPKPALGPFPTSLRQASLRWSTGLRAWYTTGPARFDHRSLRGIILSLWYGMSTLTGEISYCLRESERPSMPRSWALS